MKMSEHIHVILLISFNGFSFIRAISNIFFEDSESFSESEARGGLYLFIKEPTILTSHMKGIWVFETVFDKKRNFFSLPLADSIRLSILF